MKNVCIRLEEKTWKKLQAIAQKEETFPTRQARDFIKEAIKEYEKRLGNNQSL